METGMKAQFVAAALFALATGCVASAGPGYVGVQPVTPVVTADVQVGGDVAVVADADAEPAPIDDADYDDDVYEGEPDLVEYEGNANIRIVYGATDPAFWSDGFTGVTAMTVLTARRSTPVAGRSTATSPSTSARSIARCGSVRTSRRTTRRGRARSACVRPTGTRRTSGPTTRPIRRRARIR
jgi:hypothetical protein